MKVFILIQLTMLAQAFNLINDVPADLDPVEFFNSEIHLFDEFKKNQTYPFEANETNPFEAK